MALQASLAGVWWAFVLRGVDMYFKKPWPKYIDYIYQGEIKHFKFTWNKAGWTRGFDEKRKERVYLEPWGFQYENGLPKVAKLDRLWYDIGDGELSPAPYDEASQNGWYNY